MAAPLWILESPQQISVPLDASVYSAKAALKAAHEMTADFVVRIHEEAGSLNVTIKAKTGNIDAEQTGGDFLNRVADYRLREILDLETEAVRNVILAHALSRTSFDEPIA